MRTEIENGVVTAYLEGKVSSENAGEVQNELAALMGQYPECALQIDAGALEYISSAGLRVLLMIEKKRPGLTVRNVSPEVYEMFDVTGFTSILTVRKRLREVSVDGCEIIGRGAVGTVYRIDVDTIVKVYELPDSLTMIENEQKRAKQAFLKGIPTAISYDVVRVGDRYGSVFELLRASTYNDLLRNAPERKEEILRDFAHFLRQVHAVEMEPGALPDARDVYLSYLDGLRESLPKKLYDRLRELFAGMPEDLHVIHGDINLKNVMLSGDEPLLIDMETLSVGDPVFDLQGLLVTYQLFGEDEPDNTMQFLGISQEFADDIREMALRFYFDDRDASAIRDAELKIRIVASVRFLQLLILFNIGREDLKQLRIERTLAHLNEIAWKVDSLQLGP